MAINFGQYVYKPRPLQNWDFGEGLRDLAASRRDRDRVETGKGQLQEQRDSRRDVNTRFAATEAINQSDADYKVQLDRQAKGKAAAERARQAWAEGDMNTVYALLPTIKEYGGTADEILNPGSASDFEIKEPGMPGRNAPNFGATRSSIFGGAPSPTPGGFDMRSNVGPGSSPLAGRNPFESLPGASAAALPQARQQGPQAQPQAQPSAPPIPQGPMNGSAQLGVPQGPTLPGVGFQLQEPQLPVPQLQMPNASPLQLDAPSDARPPPENPAQPAELERSDAEVLAEPEPAPVTADDREFEQNKRLYDAQQAAAGAPPPEDPQQPPQQAQPQAQPQAAMQDEGEFPNYQLTEPQNPMNPPTFSPYRLDTNRMRQLNEQRMKPFRESMVASTPGRFRQGMTNFQSKMPGLGFSPEKELELTRPFLSEITGLWRSQLASEGQAGRLALQEGAAEQRADDVQFRKDQRLRDFAARESKKVTDSESLTATKKKVVSAQGINDAIDAAVYNPNAADAVIAQLYTMYKTGVMTDADYKNASQGMVSLWGALKNFTLDKVLKERGGFNPGVAKDIKELVEIALSGHRRTMAGARDRIYSRYKSSKNEAEREEYGDQMRQFFPDEFLPPDLREVPGGLYVDSKGNVVNLDEQDQQAPASGGTGVGTARHPIRAGSPKVSPSGTPLTRSTTVSPVDGKPRIPPKPPRKAPSDAQISGASDDELMNMLLEGRK